jgi:hypothetical protein
MLQMLHFLGSLATPWRVKWHGTTKQGAPAMLKKVALAAAALMIAAPALADPRHRDRGHGHRHFVAHKPHYVVHHRPVVVHRPAVVYHRPAPVYYRPAPRPVYVVQHHNHVNPIAVLAGAVIGAAIVHHAVTGY